MDSVLREAFAQAKPAAAQEWSRELATEWSIERLLEQPVTLEDPEDVKTAVLVVVTLLEFDFHLIERVVEALGREEALKLMEEVVSMISAQRTTPQLLDEELYVTATGRKRTPGGIFARLVKRSEKCNEEKSRWIFRNNTARQQKLRRSMKRENFAMNVCVLSESEIQTHTVAQIAKELVISEVSIIERLVLAKGVEYANNLASEVVKIIGQGAADDLIYVPDEGGRKRTPGGIFARMIKDKKDISIKQKIFIFEASTGGKFRLDVEPEIFCKKSKTSEILSAPFGASEAACSIAEGLGVERSEVHVAFVERMVQRLGENMATEIFKATRREETATGGKVGGILGDLLKKDARISPSDLAFIFGAALEFPIASGESTRCPGSPKTDVMSEVSLVRKIVRTLNLRDAEIASRAVQEVGLVSAERLLAKTIATEARGGVVVGSGERRKTPGAVFVELVRSEISPEKMAAVLSAKFTDDRIFQNDEFPTMDEGGCIFEASDDKSVVAKRVVAELERMRLSPEDVAVFAELLRVRGEEFMKYAYDKTRKFLAKNAAHTPGEVFGAVVKRKLSNEELNVLFRSHRDAQVTRVGVWALGLGVDSTEVAAGSEAAVEWGVRVGLLGYSAANRGVVERMISKTSEEKVVWALERTREIEAEGGIMTRDGKTRKTPAGVWISVLKYEGKVNNEMMHFAFAHVNSQIKAAAATSDAAGFTQQQDVHYTPSLFSPLNPWREIEKHTEIRTVANIKKIMQPIIETMQHIPIVDPRIFAIVRGGVFLGPKAIDLLDRCVYFLGERKVEELLELVHSEKHKKISEALSAFKTHLTDALAEGASGNSAAPAIDEHWLINAPTHRINLLMSDADMAKVAVVENEGWTAVLDNSKNKRKREVTENSSAKREVDANFVLRKLSLFRQTDPRTQTVLRIVVALKSASVVSVVERLVHRCGEALALDFFRKCLETADARSNVDMFTSLVKRSNSLCESDKRYIFEISDNHAQRKPSHTNSRKSL